MPKIDQRTLAELAVPVPTISVQKEIIALATRFAEDVQRVEDVIASAHRQGAALRQSLLADAFAGRLLAQDAADEPASVLLERIRAERAAMPKPKRARRSARPDPGQETLT